MQERRQRERSGSLPTQNTFGHCAVSRHIDDNAADKCFAGAYRTMVQGAPLYDDNFKGGHGGAADNAQRAHLLALEFAFLWRCLGHDGEGD